MNLTMLKDRQKMFMLKIMYKLSKDAENVNLYHPEITLRTGPKVKTKIAFTDKERVSLSPFDAILWLWKTA